MPSVFAAMADGCITGCIHRFCGRQEHCLEQKAGLLPVQRLLQHSPQRSAVSKVAVSGKKARVDARAASARALLFSQLRRRQGRVGSSGRMMSIPRVGGLHDRYDRAPQLSRQPVPRDRTFLISGCSSGCPGGTRCCECSCGLFACC